jgi:hypothetical protein
LVDGILSADAAGRLKLATGLFNEATVNDKFLAASIALDRLKEAVIQADGGQDFTANQSMGGNKLTNGANATAPTDYVIKDQIDIIGTVVRPYTAGVAVLDTVYQKPDGTVDKAAANAVATSATLQGIVERLDFPSAGQCLVRWAGDLGGFAGLVPGDIYVLATNPGGIVGETDTLNPNYPNDTVSGHVMREVGYAASPTVLFVGTNRDYLRF